MIERLLENWLIRANERSFQFPVCYWLAATGYRVVHMSRHCGMEFGKDILAIDPDGVPCAFQLKGLNGGKLTQARWRSELFAQCLTMMNTAIEHPSISASGPHRSYLVINGDLTEEVAYEVKQLNQNQLQYGFRDKELKVICKGDLLDGFKRLQSDFWPDNLTDIKTFLEVYLEDGRGQLPKEKLSNLIEASLPFENEGNSPPGRSEITRSLAGCAIVCASAISSFTNVGNHAAEFEAWTIFFGYALAIVERWKVHPKEVRFALDIATDAMYSALESLCEELMERKHFLEGNDCLVDTFVYRTRMTRLLGLMGLLALWRRCKLAVEPPDDKDAFLRKFTLDHRDLVILQGEHAVPDILTHYFHLEAVDPTLRRFAPLFGLVNGIVALNGTNEGKLFDPYYEAEDLLPYTFGLEMNPLQDSFAWQSYSLESVLHLLIRTNMRRTIAGLFTPVTHMRFFTLDFDEPWHFYLYRMGADKGHHRSHMLVPPHRWDKLKRDANECHGEGLPPSIKEYPFHFLAFIQAFPHRLNSSGIRWIATMLKELGVN